MGTNKTSVINFCTFHKYIPTDVVGHLKALVPLHVVRVRARQMTPNFFLQRRHNGTHVTTTAVGPDFMQPTSFPVEEANPRVVEQTVEYIRQHILGDRTREYNRNIHGSIRRSIEEWRLNRVHALDKTTILRWDRRRLEEEVPSPHTGFVQASPAKRRKTPGVLRVEHIPVFFDHGLDDLQSGYIPKSRSAVHIAERLRPTAVLVQSRVQSGVGKSGERAALHTRATAGRRYKHGSVEEVRHVDIRRIEER